MSEQEDALEKIRYNVWAGFYEADEITDIVYEYLDDPESLDEAWVRDQISRQFALKRAEEATWGGQTDCDRLDSVFLDLESSRIIALQNAGYTQSDGMDDISGIWYDKGAEKSNIIGYSFYHGQDLERAVNGEGLMLTFGDILGTDEKGVEVGKIIQAALERHGFQVEWDGTIEKRINIPHIIWRKRMRED